MKIYVDFDGVIIDSETHLFDGLQRFYKNGLVDNERDYLKLMDWYSYLKKCDFIPGSLDILKEYKETMTILGKVCSEQEEKAKRKILLENGYYKMPIFLDADDKKSRIVDPKGNILIDDTVHNLVDWEKEGGIPVYFNKDGIQTDPWKNTNPGYRSIKTLRNIPYIK